MISKKQAQNSNQYRKAKEMGKNPNENSNLKSNQKNGIVIDDKKSYYLIPFLIILCIVPVILQFKEFNNYLSGYSWYVQDEKSFDLFLYYKHLFLIIIGGYMLLAVAIRIYINRKDANRETARLEHLFIPLSLYAVFAIVSTIFSVNQKISIFGGVDLFETIFVLLTYCIIVFYARLYLNSEKDFRFIFNCLIGIGLVFGVIGLLQYLGFDIINTEVGYNLLVPSESRGLVNLSLSFGAKRVYLTLFNPNYVGVYVSLIIPILLFALLFQKKIYMVVLSIITIVGLIICLVGSLSLSSIIGIGAAVFFMIILLWRYIMKRWYVFGSALIIFVIGAFLLNSSMNNYFSNKLINSLKIQKSEAQWTDLHTEKDYISLTCSGNEVRIAEKLNNDNTFTIIAYDAEYNLLDASYDSQNGLATITDSRFPGLTYQWDKTYQGVFDINVAGNTWRFTNNTEDGSYMFVNRWNRLDKIVPAKSALFTGYEGMATNRGFIWSRTIPLLKDYILLGSGPDTFIIVFPQQDYFNLFRFGYGTEFINKPHNMYLQMAVQTGLLSLVAFLLFYLMYFISSLRIYIKGRFHNYYAILGAAIFVGTISYMIVGLANDSNINTAPTFWVLIGTGIALNRKAKPLILEEVRLEKEEKAKKLYEAKGE